METKQRRYQDVAAELRAMILAEGHAPGARLPTERQIAQRLDVGRNLVRDAVIMLEVEGLVQVRQGSGIYLLADPAQAPSIPTEDIGPFELLEARLVIETAIAGLAAMTVTKADITALRDTLEEERRAITQDGDYSGDERFHLLVAGATQNGALAAAVADLWERRRSSRMWAQLHNRIFDQTYREGWLDDHQAILDALRARDSARARAAMAQHIRNVVDTLMDLSDPDDPAFDGHLFSSARTSRAV